MQPFLKWAGGKRREAAVLAPLIRERLAPGSTYVEPFAGSAALFFILGLEQNSILNDALPELANLYNCVRDDPAGVEGALDILIAEGWHEEPYYKIRADRPEDSTGLAAWMLYLNKTAFNGLWRTNKKGGFNAPCGKYKKPKFAGHGELTEASRLLEWTAIHNCDWEALLDDEYWAWAGDCLFVDPPYPGTFQGYASAARVVDIGALGERLRRLSLEGVGSVTTLPPTPEVHDAFQWCTEIDISRTGTISATPEGRGKLSQSAWASPL